jgi:heat shock protein 4
VLTFFFFSLQDWLYDEGEDTTKAAYVAKMDEIRFVAGPIIQRYNDKLEEERQTILKAQEEVAAKKRAEADAKKKAEEEAKKGAEPKKTEDTEMPDADGEAVRPDSVDEPTK